MSDTSEVSGIADILKNKMPVKKAPAYEWQDFALYIIKELNIPNFKRSAVFKICKDYSKDEVTRAMNDTKELCLTGEKWKYFFKIITLKKDEPKI